MPLKARGRRLTVVEAAARAGCNIETLRRAIKNRELLATRHPTAKGRPYQILAADLDAFLLKRATMV